MIDKAVDVVDTVMKCDIKKIDKAVEDAELVVRIDDIAFYRASSDLYIFEEKGKRCLFTYLNNTRLWDMLTRWWEASWGDNELWRFKVITAALLYGGYYSDITKWNYDTLTQAVERVLRGEVTISRYLIQNREQLATLMSMLKTTEFIDYDYEEYKKAIDMLLNEFVGDYQIADRGMNFYKCNDWLWIMTTKRKVGIVVTYENGAVDEELSKMATTLIKNNKNVSSVVSSITMMKLERIFSDRITRRYFRLVEDRLIDLFDAEGEKI